MCRDSVVVGRLNCRRRSFSAKAAVWHPRRGYLLWAQSGRETAPRCRSAESREVTRLGTVDGIRTRDRRDHKPGRITPVEADRCSARGFGHPVGTGSRTRLPADLDVHLVHRETNATPWVTPTVLPRATTSPRRTSTTARALAASSSTDDEWLSGGRQAGDSPTAPPCERPPLRRTAPLTARRDRP
jgi:hypothetical protein